jgi:uncharacterized protein YbjQ (UPF0145 family)
MSTTNDLPGYTIEEVLGEVFGTTWTEICAYGTAARATRA